MCDASLPTLEAEFRQDQPLLDVVALALDNLKINSFNRKLKREDGTLLPDWSVLIGDAPGEFGMKGVYPNETLRFFISAKKPDRDKGWAMTQADSVTQV